MRAAVVRSRGATPELQQWPDPEVDRTQAVGRLVAAALNPLDLLIAAGKHPIVHPDPPFVAGYEAVVEDEDGRRRYVSGPLPPAGTLADLIPYDPEVAFDVTASVDPAVACVLGVTGLAAWMALDDRGDLASGETVLVLGAAGQVGRLALQFAKLLGAGDVVAAARAKQLPGLQDEGIVGVALDDDRGFDAALAEAAPAGCDVIIDLLWGDSAIQALGHTASNARFVQVGNSAQATAPIPAVVLRDHLTSIVGHSVPKAPVADRRAAFARLLGHADAITLDIQRTRLADIAQTWARLQNHSTEKLVVCP